MLWSHFQQAEHRHHGSGLGDGLVGTNRQRVVHVGVFPVNRTHKLFSRQLVERLEQALITSHTGVLPKLL